MVKIKARNASIVADYITASTLSTADKKLLDKFKARLIVQDGMVVEPFTEKLEIGYDKKYADQIPKLADYLANVFLDDDVEYDNKFPAGKGSVRIGKINLKFAPKKEGKRNQTPTKVQERGTVVVFNKVLRNKSPKVYKNVESLEADKKLMDELKDTFTSSKYGGSKKLADNVHDWLLTYFEQQHHFLNKYAPSKWQPFEYNGKSFVAFFSDYIKKFQTYDGTMIKKYTEWNPADIWAAYDLSKMQTDIKEAFELDMKDPESPPKVSRLNNLLIQYMKDEKLIGISLKKIEKQGSSHIELFNISPKSMKVSQVVSYKWSDIKFRIDNISKNTLVTTYIKYKSTHEMNINLGDKKKFGNLSFNTQIKDSSAQGGQAPVEQVVSLLHTKGPSKDFVNDHNKYPHDVQKYWDEEKIWHSKYDFVKTKTSGLISWTDFDKYITGLYKQKLPQVAASKLMQISFYYDAFKNYPNDQQFWISLLHLGMKVGKRFAPHAKISD